MGGGGAYGGTAEVVRVSEGTVDAFGVLVEYVGVGR